MRRLLFQILIGLLSLVSVSIHADDNGWSTISENGLYTIKIQPQHGQIPIARRHAWTITINDQDSNAVQPSKLAFYGGMRGHGHGLPSSPRITREIESGTYLVEGVVFNMHGDWEIVVGVVGPEGPDKATFELTISPPVDESSGNTDWSPQEVALMRSLALPDPVAPPGDASNRFNGIADSVALGQALFFDKGLSLNNDIACASCHEPRLYFTDGKRRSVGSRELQRNSPTLLGVAHSDWFYWDGRRDSLWAQALTPIETPGEMDGNRIAVVRHVLTQTAYAEIIQTLVEDLPDLKTLPESGGPYGSTEDKSRWAALPSDKRRQVNETFAAIGKIIASYVSTLEPEPSRFDAYVASLTSDSGELSPLAENEIRGLRLFLDPQKTQCLRCHNGPYFSNYGFSNIGTSIGGNGELPDFGRMIGLQAALVDEFNCVGRYSDAEPDGCGHHRYAAKNHADNGAFKVPTLRNVAMTAPYMHDGRFDDLISVLEFYRDPPSKDISNHELPPLDLTDAELRDLASFLSSLTGPAAEQE